MDNVSNWIYWNAVYSCINILDMTQQTFSHSDLTDIIYLHKIEIFCEDGYIISCDWFHAENGTIIYGGRYANGKAWKDIAFELYKFKVITH